MPRFKPSNRLLLRMSPHSPSFTSHTCVFQKAIMLLLGLDECDLPFALQTVSFLVLSIGFTVYNAFWAQAAAKHAWKRYIALSLYCLDLFNTRISLR